MGFDINITMDLQMCPATGKPFYFKYNKEKQFVEKIYDFPNILVPGKMCEYLEGRGHIFHAYTQKFNDNERYSTSVEEFLEEYPSWEDVVKSHYYENEDYYWHQEDHEGFKRLLEWCAEQDVPFTVRWSY